MRSLRRPLAVVTSVLLAAGLAACSTDAVKETSTGGDGAPEAAANITVSSEFGDVEIPAEPTAALGMYTTDVDILITLGFPLADQQPIRGDGWTTFPVFFPQEPLADVTPFENYPDYNYEKILETQPDFILNGLGYDNKTVKRLPEIAPTFSLNAFDGRSWMVHFKETAQALDRMDEYDAWMAEYEARTAEIKEAIGDKADGLVVAPLNFWDGKASSSCYSGVECQAFSDLGLTVWPDAELKDGEGVTLGAEQLGRMKDVDIAFATAFPGEKGEEEYQGYLDKFGKNPLWDSLDFVSANKLISYDLEMTYGSPSGQLAFLDVVEQAVAG